MPNQREEAAKGRACYCVNHPDDQVTLGKYTNDLIAEWKSRSERAEADLAAAKARIDRMIESSKYSSANQITHIFGVPVDDIARFLTDIKEQGPRRGAEVLATLSAALAKVKALEEERDAARQWSEFASSGCRLCEYRDGVFIKHCGYCAKIAALESRLSSLLSGPDDAAVREAEEWANRSTGDSRPKTLAAALRSERARRLEVEAKLSTCLCWKSEYCPVHGVAIAEKEVEIVALKEKLREAAPLIARLRQGEEELNKSHAEKDAAESRARKMEEALADAINKLEAFEADGKTVIMGSSITIKKGRAALSSAPSSQEKPK